MTPGACFSACPPLRLRCGGACKVRVTLIRSQSGLWELPRGEHASAARVDDGDAAARGGLSPREKDAEMAKRGDTAEAERAAWRRRAIGGRRLRQAQGGEDGAAGKIVFLD